MPRLAVLVTHPVQYFAPVFQELTHYPDLEIKVFFGCDHGVRPREDPNFGVIVKWDCEPTANFGHEFLYTGLLEGLKNLSGIKLATKAATAINRYQPDYVLIFSYSPSFITASTILLYLAGHKLMLRAETTDTAFKRSYFKDRIRQFILNFYYQQFTHFFPIGTNSTNHYSRMGVEQSRFTVARYAIDVEFFQKQVDYWLPQRGFLRAAMGIEIEDEVLLYCGKMFPPKNPLLIPQALSLLSPQQKDRIWLVAVGDGEFKKAFEKSAKAQLGNRAIFVGFKNQSELGKYYALSDTLILPSQSGETWGLVVNEALQFGLRVIVSDKVGSGRDLIQNERTGLIFPSGDPIALSKAITQFMIFPKSSSRSLSILPHPKELAQAVYSRVKKDYSQV